MRRDHLNREDLSAELVRGELGRSGEVWREEGKIGEVAARRVGELDQGVGELGDRERMRGRGSEGE